MSAARAAQRGGIEACRGGGQWQAQQFELLALKHLKNLRQDALIDDR